MALAAALLVATLPVPASAHSLLTRACRHAGDWPMFGHDLGRSFATTGNCITAHNASTVRPKWYYDAHAPVTAQPIVVDGIAYVGAYNGRFHAIRVSDGKPAWRKPFNIRRYDNNLVDFGAIPGSAAVATVGGRKVVIFGGGGTVFALDARDGALVDRICLDRVDTTCQGKAGYTTEIESSPAVVVSGDGSTAQVLIGTDVNEASPSGPAGLVSLEFDGRRFSPQWWFDPEVGLTYNGLAPTQDVKHLSENGCNDVWSSPTIVDGLVVFGIGNCNHPERVHRGSGAHGALVEGTVALDLATGAFRWHFTPRPPNDLDLDFGATPNLLSPGVIGEGGKDGVYYANEAATGRPLWQVKVGEPSAIGGIIASTATGYFSDGHRAVFAATAIPSDATTHPGRVLGVHAIDATTHTVRWHTVAGATYGAPIFAGRLVFVPNTFSNSLLIFRADNGVPLRVQPMNAPPASPPVVVGDTVLLGTGITEAIPVVDKLGSVGGVWAFTTTT